ncbi:MAG: Flagellar protein FlgJ, partial [Sphingomonas bacterium]|nr:Flagellar protein FlgJ [Sphingomonas bacterium]
GSGETSTSDAAMWAHATLDRLNGTAASTTTAASLLRPTPNTARLAYMMLASLGG